MFVTGDAHPPESKRAADVGSVEPDHVEQHPAYEVVPLARTVTQTAASPDPNSVHEDNDLLLLAGTSRRNAWTDIAVVAAVLVLAELMVRELVGNVLALAGYPLDGSSRELNRSLFFPLILVRGIIVVLVVGGALRVRRQSWSTVGVSTHRFRHNILFGIVAVMTAGALSFAWVTLLWMFWPNLMAQMSENAERIMHQIPKQHPAVLVLITLTVAVYEEILFRGFLLPRLRRATGSWLVATVLSTALFTSLHSFEQTTAALVPITMLSLVFSVFAIWRRSVVPVIVGHFLFNLVQFLALYVQAGDRWT